jgi:hypothetical protein
MFWNRFSSRSVTTNELKLMRVSSISSLVDEVQPLMTLSSCYRRGSHSLSASMGPASVSSSLKVAAS